MMTQTQAQLYVVKGMISELPAEDQNKINGTVERLRALASEAGDYGATCLAVAALELAKQE